VFGAERRGKKTEEGLKCKREGTQAWKEGPAGVEGKNRNPGSSKQ